MRLQGSEEGDEMTPQWKWTGLETRQEGGKGLLLQMTLGARVGPGVTEPRHSND